MKTLLFAIALAGMTTTGALAQNKQNKPDRTPTPAKKRCADAKDPRCAKDVEFRVGDKVKGERPSGDGDAVTGVLGTRFGSLIRVRTHFNDMIYKSIESL